MLEATVKHFNIAKIRNDFPILSRNIKGKPLIYLDNSNSSQKPNTVIDTISNYYQNSHANIHRGVYELSQLATKAFEQTREHVKNFINAKSTEEIIFTSGTTQGINLVAQCYGRSQFKAGDEIIISTMEHHSNIVPWHMLAQQCGAIVRAIPISDVGELDLDAYEKLFNAKTKFVSVTQASNVLGTINPIKQMIKIAHQHGVPVLVDGAQAFPHMAVNVQELDCDFYVFSSHKAYGPTGVGVLYGKKELLAKMPPYQGGGDMIETVTLTDFTCNKLPAKFEAGTPNIADVIGFDAALHYLSSIGMDAIAQHEQALLHYANDQLAKVDKLRIIGQSKHKLGVISFVMEDIHPHDLGTVLDHEGIAIRAGHHCAMPLMQRYNVPATARISFAIYNTHAEIDLFIAALAEAKRIFA